VIPSTWVHRSEAEGLSIYTSKVKCAGLDWCARRPRLLIAYSDSGNERFAECLASIQDLFGIAN